MLRLSRKLFFTLEAVLDIAYNGGGAPVQSKAITHRQGIPPRYTEQVMQRLARAGLLSGVRGPRGGYRLARERRRITVGEIARVVYASDDATTPEGSSALAKRVLGPLRRELQDEIAARLDAITIEDLCRRAQAAGVSCARDRSPDSMV